ncbi:MAG: CinA family protein [Lachnospiraceae bacterium]|nr:CinA family protein [Lachnospiraceae bacterium]
MKDTMDQIMDDIELGELLDELRRRGKTVTTAESCTGGLLAGRITDIPGSSDVFHQGFVTYCDRAKHKLLQVKKKTLKRYTAVSRQTAKEMAKGGAKAAGAGYALSVTGYAGPPSGDGDDSVGLVYIGCFYEGRTRVQKCHFTGTRTSIRRQSVETALSLLRSCIAE